MERLSERTQHYLDEISRICLEKKLTIAIAESVTSGFLQLLFSNARNATCFFQGGITAYNGGQKARHLGVEPIYAMECNCVDKEITAVMAANVRTMFCSHIGIAITGYATPIPEDNISEPFAWMCITGPQGIMLQDKIHPHSSYSEGLTAQTEYATTVLHHLYLLLDMK